MVKLAKCYAIQDKKKRCNSDEIILVTWQLKAQIIQQRDIERTGKVLSRNLLSFSVPIEQKPVLVVLLGSISGQRFVGCLSSACICWMLLSNQITLSGGDNGCGRGCQGQHPVNSPDGTVGLMLLCLGDVTQCKMHFLQTITTD